MLLALLLLLPLDAPPAQEQQLAALFRQLVLDKLPTPLVEKSHNWGHQREVVVGMKFRHGRPEVQKAVRNDGVWQNLKVEAIDPANTLSLGISDITSPEAGRTTFLVTLAQPVRAWHETQVWKSGARLVGSTTQARVRGILKLRCELASRVELPAGQFVPVAVVRLHVVAADVGYDGFVCEQVVGLHGKMAKVTGDALKAVVTAIKPDLEAKALERANAEVVKAADTREVRLELGRLLKGQSPVVK